MGADHVGLGPGRIDEDAVDGPRIAGRASAKNSGNVPRARPEDTGALDGAQVLLGWRPSDDNRANTALTWIRDLSARHPVANRKDRPLLSEDDFESSLDTVCEAAAGSIEGVFGPASLTWRVDREAAVFLGAGRALLLRYLPRLNR